ncbi:MAG: sugar ABC transporter ATP-binding protein [Rhodobacteraceae bacterium]|nr:sugar ABC transporter ATP-binding protein [Paracoccaceae bacterium]
MVATCSVTKDYPGVRALDSVDFDLRSGEVHTLFGENGAGKSTLISILAGAVQPTSGTLYFKGRRVSLHSVHDARELGISAVFQDFSLIPQMTVEENLFLGAEPRNGAFIDRRRSRRHAREILDELDFRIDPAVRVEQLTRAERQMVEIAKAFRSDLSVLILDEPTASLTNHETDRLFRLIGELTARGIGIVYITHRMAEIWRIGSRITVLRDGCHIDTVDAQEASEDVLVQLMTGREVGKIFPERSAGAAGASVLEIEELTTRDGTVEGVSLDVRAGEIVGLAGLVGSGKSELLQAAFGARPIAAGRVRYLGRECTGHGPRRNIRNGFLYLPSDRRTEGLMMMRPARENITLPALDIEPFSRGPLLKPGDERRAAGELADRMNLQPRRTERTTDQFSGGNQQKVMLARSLTREFRLIAFDEPTVGVDMGTRAAIYEFIVELARQGVAIVLVSSDLPEILHLSDRAYVFYRGRVQAQLQGARITEEAVLAHFFEREGR